MEYFSYSRAIAVLPLAAAWLLIAFRAKQFLRICRLGRERMGEAFGCGVVFIGCLIILFVLLTGIGILTVVMSLLYFMSLFSYAVIAVVALAQAVALVVVGSRVRGVPPEDTAWLSAFAGFVVLMLASWIPHFGKSMNLLASALGFGSLLLRFLEYRKIAW